MQPTVFQRLFTDDRPLYFLMAAGAIAMLLFAGSILAPTLTASAWSIGQFIVLMSAAACLGAVLGAFPGAPVSLLFDHGLWLLQRVMPPPCRPRSGATGI